MDIHVGDKFKVKIGNVLIMTVYTVEEITTKPNGSISIRWSCVGKKNYFRRVGKQNIESWVDEGRLVKVKDGIVT